MALRKYARMFAVAALMAAGAVLSAPGAQAQASARDLYPQVRAKFADGVVGLPDLAYATYTGYQPLKLDLYLPKPSKQKHPLVMYVHGGSWIGGTSRRAGTFENWPGVLASIAARGYVVASINYRLAGEAKFPAPAQDVKAAIRWVRQNADKYGVDPSRVVIWGGSAGGHLAGLAGASCGVATLSPPADANAAGPVSDCAQGVILWYPITDVETMEIRRPNGEGAVANMLGCQLRACPAGFARLASPVAHVDAGDPPFLIIHGDSDKTVPVSQSQNLYDALKAKGVDAELLIIPGVDHSFMGASPEANRATNTMVIARVNAFIDRVVGPSPPAAK